MLKTIIELYSLMILVFFSYVIFIWIKYGVQKSISDSYYKLSKNMKFMFTLFCWGFSIPAVIIGLELAKDTPYQFLIFLAVTGIMFVGAAPDFKDVKLEKKIHTVAAVAGIVFSQVYLFLVFYNNFYLIPGSVLTVLLFMSLTSKYPIWWVEISAFVSLIIGYGIGIYLL